MRSKGEASKKGKMSQENIIRLGNGSVRNMRKENKAAEDDDANQIQERRNRVDPSKSLSASDEDQIQQVDKRRKLKKAEDFDAAVLNQLNMLANDDVCDLLSDDVGVVDQDSQISNDCVSIVSNQQPQCRICWMDEYCEENPLLQVCLCRGGVEFIHYDCLKNWLKTKEYRHVTTHYTSIYWRQFQCELCKSQLPYVFRNNGRSYSLITLPELDCDHIVLESITLEVKTARMVHILHPKTGYFVNFKGFYSIGRGQDCDLKISDISVSRNHCQINYRDGKFWLQDKQSKFGTLVLC